MEANRPPAGRERLRSRGVLSFELLLILPIVLLLIWGIIELSVHLAVRQRVAAASREGARVAAVGGSRADVERAVHLSLGDALFGKTTLESADHRSGAESSTGHDVVVVRVRLRGGSGGPSLLGVGNQEIVVQSVMRRE